MALGSTTECCTAGEWLEDICETTTPAVVLHVSIPIDEDSSSSGVADHQANGDLMHLAAETAPVQFTSHFQGRSAIAGILKELDSVADSLFEEIQFGRSVTFANRLRVRLTRDLVDSHKLLWMQSSDECERCVPRQRDITEYEQNGN